MNIGKARALFEQIAEGNLENYTIGEYLEAVSIVSNMATFNSITKDQFIKVFKWLVTVAERAVSPYRWIPVEERLPKEKINPNTLDFEKVLCSTTFGDVRVYGYGAPVHGWDEHFWHGPGAVDSYVTAWMPMPEPYKGESK